MTKDIVVAVLATVLATIIITLITWAFKKQKFIRDESKIIGFLKNSKKSTTHSFRSTQAISSNTNLCEKRVEEVCSISSKIKRNSKEKQSWRLYESNN